MKAVQVRRFSEDDRSPLKEMYLKSREHAFDWLGSPLFQLDDFDRDTDGEIIWVGTKFDRPVGFISVWEPEDFIHNLFVHPDFFGCGIGSMLLNEALANIGRPARLKCEERNVQAREFYLSRGWSIVGEGDGNYGRWLLMQFNGREEASTS